MSPCADIQSARPIANAVEVPAPVVTRREPITDRVLWVWIDKRTPSNAFVIPVGTGARPFAPPRFISDQSTDSLDWLSYEHPWVAEEAEGFFAGEIEWPDADLE